MTRIRKFRRVFEGNPTIQSPSFFVRDEGTPLGHQLVADRDVIWSVIGGANAADVVVEANAGLEWRSGLGVAGSYEVQVQATSVMDVSKFATQTITGTVNDIGAATPGVPSLSVIVASESEVVVTTQAADAVSYEIELDNSGDWNPLLSSGIIRDLDPVTDYDLVSRGIGLDGQAGPESAIESFTTLAAPAAYAPAVFRYGSGYLTRGASPTGLADGKEFTSAVIMEFEGGDGVAQRVWSNAGNNFRLRKRTDNKLEIYGQNAAGSVILQGVTVNTYTALSGRLPVIISANMATGALHFYVGDTPAELSPATVVNDNLDMATGNWSIGAAPDGTSLLQAAISEFFFHDQYLDISQLINRRKFIGPLGQPRNLGSDGSAVFGEPALIYLKTGSSPGQNSGSGGNFTVNGTITWINDTSAAITLTPAQADEFVEFFSVQLHVERTEATHSASNNESDWSNPGWRQSFVDLGIRHARSKIGSEPLSGEHVQWLWDEGQIRFVTNVTAYVESTGALNQTATDRNLRFLEETVGLEKIVGVEGPNEYTYDKKFWKNISAVNVDSNVITTAVDHLFSAGDRVVFQNTPDTDYPGESGAAGVLPAPLTEHPQAYYVLSDSLTARNLKVSTTRGGSAVNITSTGSGFRRISNWPQRVWDIQEYLYNYVRGRSAWAHVLVIAPSLWRRKVIDYQALGDLSSIADIGHLHYYQGNRRPSRYNKTENGSGDDPMEDAITDCQIYCEDNPVYIGESGFDLAVQEDPGDSGPPGRYRNEAFTASTFAGNYDQAITVDTGTDVWTTPEPHGLVVNDKVYIYTTGTLNGSPGISPLPTTYLVASVIGTASSGGNLGSSTQLTLKTSAGTAINITSQSGTHRIGYAYRWNGDLASPDTVAKHILREWAEFYHRREVPGVFKHNYYVYQSDHRTNQYGLINRHSWDGTWEERTNYWSVRNLIRLMQDTYTVTVSGNTWTIAGGHSLQAGDQVRIKTTGSLTGVTLGRTHYVLSTGLTGTDFRLSLTAGGSAVSVSAQSGVHTLIMVDWTPATLGLHSLDLSNLEAPRRYNVFAKRNGRYYLMFWNDVVSWRRTSPYGETFPARVNVPIHIANPTFSQMKIWEPTMLQARGDTASSGLSPISTDNNPMTAKTLSVPDHLQVVELIP